ncbi:hypothetical protein I2F17_03740 [Acinetobacter sp. B10A]|uniref:hypothetical protein n=1 Tax=Acinetobacter baretiae TaxID=2605383 RepID=UPI001B3C7A32|nr:hypothetical protein [Acinetobacter baretiae]MBF7684937.1 hypothetical protein [Acinetobacter baretiae]
MISKNSIFLIVSSFLLNTHTMADEKVILGAESTVQQYIPVAVGLNVGSLGYGATLMWDTDTSVGVTLGYTHHELWYNKDVSTSFGTWQRQSTNSRSHFLHVEWKPWQVQSKLLLKSSYLSVGAAYLQQSYALNQPDHERSGIIKSNQISPYIGIGMRPMLGLHWGWLAEMGVHYIPQPSMFLSQETAQSIWVKKDRWLPVAQIGVVYHF